jgi:hypothetical protein
VGYLDPPFDVPGIGAVTKPALQIIGREISNIRPPVSLFLNPIKEPALKSAQLEKEVLAISYFWGVFRYATFDIYELSWVKGFAAVITLVSPGTLVAAVRAFALNVAVRQKTLAGMTVRLRHGVFVYRPIG